MSRIALIGENSIEYVNALIDIWNDGDCAVLLDWRIPVKTLYSMMLEANVKVCYIEKSLLDKINPVDYPLISFVVYDNTTKEASLLPNDVYVKYKENYSKDEAVVIYSSGTTGRSKGIILSHYAITVNADAIVDYMQPQENDCIYTVRPLSHSSTLTGELLVALRSKCRLLLAPTIVPPRCIFKNIQKHKVTELCVNPTLLSMLCDEKARDCIDISSLKKIYCSGSILDDGIFYKAKSMFGGLEIYNVYGLSEAGPRVSAQRHGLCRNNSVGKAINGVEIAIVDEKGNELLHNERGIIHVNTLSRFSGYVSGVTKHSSLYKNWLNTGDVGYFDNYGELHIVSRVDDVILLGAHKIYPSDVVTQIQKMSDVEECVVVKIHLNSDDLVCCLYSAPVTIRSDIKNVLGKVLLKHEIPKVFIRTESVPKTLNGKINIQLAIDIIINRLKGA